MDAALNRTSLMYGVPGLILQTAAAFLPAMLGYSNPQLVPTWVNGLTWLGVLGGTALLIVGLSYYAAAKGHSRWAGLLGLRRSWG